MSKRINLNVFPFGVTKRKKAVDYVMRNWTVNTRLYESTHLLGSWVLARWVNATAERIFPISQLEGHQLEFRAEAINVLNHPNGGTVSTDVLDSNFGNVDVTINGNRSLRLWLKYRF